MIMGPHGERSARAIYSPVQTRLRLLSAAILRRMLDRSVLKAGELGSVIRMSFGALMRRAYTDPRPNAFAGSGRCHLASDAEWEGFRARSVRGPEDRAICSPARQGRVGHKPKASCSPPQRAGVLVRTPSLNHPKGFGPFAALSLMPAGPHGLALRAGWISNSG
jgi:hypothetical protein